MQRVTGTVRTAALTTAAKLICGPSEKRLSLLFSPAADRDVYYTISTESGLALGAGINVLADGGPVTISVAAHGDAAMRSWYAIASAAVTIGYLETVEV
ncbi:MAG: hypothetical protein U0359_20700 [Byssovorax sp.]